MKKFIIGIVAFITCIGTTKAQELNDYKYIIVPEKYGFLDEVDQYRLNSMTKFLFAEEGFETLMASESKPSDLQANPCLGLNAELEKTSGLFTNKLILKLKNCSGVYVLESKEGSSRIKDYEKGYQAALREAFESVTEQEYAYNPAEVIVQATPKVSQMKENRKPVEDDEVIEVVEEEVVEEEVEPSKKAETTSEVAEATKALEEVNRKAEANAANSDMGMTKSGTFSRDGKTYLLEKSSNGYNLIQQGSAEPSAIIIKSDLNSAFIYRSLSMQGVGYFDMSGNFIVEYLDASNSKQKIKFTKS